MTKARNSRRHHSDVQCSADRPEGLEPSGEGPDSGVGRDLKELLADVDLDGVRIEKLAHAQQLAADATYPPKEVLEAVADLLAKHLRPGDEG